MIARSFDDLAVYRRSVDACAAVSALLRRPTVRADCELRAQLSSASAAVPANIAEGFGQQSDRQFARYLFIARGSCHEMRAHLAVAYGRGHVDSDAMLELSAKYEEIAKLATGLIRYLRASNRKHRG
jgi:four helix bundle protein